MSSGAGGALMERSIAQLSGGEKKRVALALGLGFAEVVAARGRLTSNILVLDEVSGIAWNCCGSKFGQQALCPKVCLKRPVFNVTSNQ
jgi:hypothetical protein